MLAANHKIERSRLKIQLRSGRKVMLCVKQALIVEFYKKNTLSFMLPHVIHGAFNIP